MIRFAQPYFLLLLAVPVAYLAFYYRHRFLKPAALSYSNLGLLGRPQKTVKTMLHDLQPLLRALGMALAVLAVARPQTSFGQRDVYSEGIDIMLVLDTSGSMRAEDFKPINRLAVSKEVIRNFIQGRQGDRIGLVVFSKQAFTQCPLTTDYGLLLRLLDMVDFGMVEDGTAIGLALANAANRLMESRAKSKVIVLLTDGANNAGEIDPLTAAHAVAALGIKVYAIGAGTEGLVDMPVVDPIFGKRYVKVRSDVDEELLRQVAAITGGLFFRATNSEALQKIYEQISSMEKTKVEVKEYYQYDEHYEKFLALGLILLAGEFVCWGFINRSLP